MDPDAGTTRFRLRAFGGLSVEAADGVPLPDFSAQRKALALLALLAKSGTQGLARDKVLAFLWPESDTDQARNALYNLLFRLRRALSAEAIIGTAELRLDFSHISSDVAEFEQAIAASAFETAARLYVGPFLDGFYLKEAPEFERWSTDERARLGRAYVDVLEQLAAAAGEAGETGAAVTWWRKRTEADPLSARAAREYVEALVTVGDREAALSFIAAHSALVRSELGADPDPELTRRADQLRRAPAPITGPASPAITPASSSVAAFPPASETSAPTGARRARPAWTRKQVAVGATIGLVIVTVAVAARRFAQTDLDPHRVLVAAFDNRTGDSTLDAFGRIAADGVTQELVRSGVVEVVDPVTSLTTSREVRDTIAELESLPALRMLARETRAGLVISGSYFRDGDDIVVQAHVTDARRAEVIAATEPIRAPVAQRTALIDSIRQRVMGSLALRLDDRLAKIVPAGNTPTYAAYEAFISGLEIFTTGRIPQSAPYFARAYALDTSFIESLVWQAFAVQGSPAKRDSIVQILEQHRNSLSELDRYAVDYHRATVSGSLEEQLAAARGAAELAPGSHWTHNVGVALNQLGRSREAIKVFESIDRNHGWVRSWPGFWMAYERALHVTGKHREELEVASAARTVLPANHALKDNETIALAVNRRWDALEQRMRDIERSPDNGYMLRDLAGELHAHGEDQRAHEVSERAVRWYANRAASGPADDAFRADFARTLYAAGHWTEAGNLIDSLRTQHASDLQLKTLSALVAARMGDRGRARAMLDSIVQRDTGLDADPRRTSAARIAAVLGDRSRAVALLQQVRYRNSYDRHYLWFAIDFDSLVGFPPYERLIAER